AKFRDWLLADAAGYARRVDSGPARSGRRRAVSGVAYLAPPELPMRRASRSAFRASLLILALAAAGAAPALAADPPAAAPEAAPDAALQAALAGDWRSEANRARDAYRHPAQTLGFFGLAPGQTVVE